jgi:hypothetical protein
VVLLHPVVAEFPFQEPALLFRFGWHDVSP